LALKFTKMQDGPLKTALAISLLGKAGAMQIPLLNDLGATLEAIQQETQQFGLIVGTSTMQLARPMCSPPLIGAEKKPCGTRLRMRSSG
jgi:hypothetical protein